jgi:hypothetical protein
LVRQSRDAVDNIVRLGDTAMTLTLKSIVLYSHQGDVRVLPFKSGSLNIITGESKTGKSAIIDIIDYCLGRGHCNVAEGVIRRSVSWFALDIVNGEDALFVARRNPGPGTDTSAEIYVRRGTFDGPPPLEEIQKNIIEEELISLLTRFTGIAENEHRPVSGTRLPLQATIRHALFLCFQKQDEIDNRERLFHRQGEQFIPQAIKDTFPYFLGAVDESQFLKQYELDIARDALRTLQQKAAQFKEQRNADLNRVRRLINDGKRVGIVRQDFEPVDVDAAIAILEAASRIELTSDASIPDFGETINRIRNEQKELRELLGQVADEIRATRLIISEHNAYSREGAEQRARLSAIGLFKDTDVAGDHCPLCENVLAVPTTSAEQIRLSLVQINRQLDAVEVEQPHLQKHLEELETKRQKLESDLIETQSALSRAIAEDERARAQQDMLLERARVLGRIGSFLDSIRPPEDEVDLTPQIEAAERKVAALEAEVNADDVAQRVDTYLNLISKKMSEYADKLDLEHSGSALRLDLKKLTVVADTEDGPVPLNRMGSGENWIGYHVLTHLALHWWFRKRNRPLPGILIFDQPSQAHYPAERDEDGKLDPLDDKDRQAVHALFELMHHACQEIGEGFQLIVLDHVKMSDDWFQAGMVEEWRRGNFLVPPEWDGNRGA